MLSFCAYGKEPRLYDVYNNIDNVKSVMLETDTTNAHEIKKLVEFCESHILNTAKFLDTRLQFILLKKG